MNLVNHIHPLGSEVVAIAGPEHNSWTADLCSGYFVGEVDCRFYGSRRIILLSDFTFVDSTGHRWFAPRGSVCDGSSIPWLIQRWMGSPLVGLHRFASVVHDVACVEKKMPSTLVHKMYRDACRAAGESKAWALYQGVRFGGPKFTGII